jgi:hypothetical protein
MKGSMQKFLNKAIRNNEKPRIINMTKPEYTIES